MPRGGHNAVDLLGQRFGMLVAVERMGHTTRFTSRGVRPGALIWRCRCDCGTDVLVRADKLRAGRRKRCATARHKEWVVQVRLEGAETVRRKQEAADRARAEAAAAAQAELVEQERLRLLHPLLVAPDFLVEYRGVRKPLAEVAAACKVCSGHLLRKLRMGFSLVESIALASRNAKKRRYSELRR